MASKKVIIISSVVIISLGVVAYFLLKKPKDWTSENLQVPIEVELTVQEGDENVEIIDEPIDAQPIGDLASVDLQSYDVMSGMGDF